MLATLSILSCAHVHSELPNVVLFLVDDLGYGDLGFTGHPTTLTPKLDELSRQGKRLTTWYSAYPVCTSSRPMLSQVHYPYLLCALYQAVMTGRQPPRLGMPGVINSLSAAGLPLTELTVQEFGNRQMVSDPFLKSSKGNHGRRSTYVVDDGEGFASPCTPAMQQQQQELLQRRGWLYTEENAAASDAAANSRERLRPTARDEVTLGPSLPLPLIHQNKALNISEILEQPVDITQLTPRWSAMVENFTRSYYVDSPLFLYLAFAHVHTATPNIPGLQYSSCSFVNVTRRGRFGDALAEVDWMVGRVWTLFEELEIANNTLFLFWSDNGPSLRWGASAGSTGLFTGRAAGYPDTGKGSTWEGGIRMPAFAVWPGKITPGTSTPEVVSSLDVLPTLLRLAGIPAPTEAGKQLDGVDFVDLLLDDAGLSKHTFLPFYNEPQIANASTRIFAARMQYEGVAYKLHWITSP
eukprot:gene15940-20237_t